MESHENLKFHRIRPLKNTIRWISGLSILKYSFLDWPKADVILVSLSHSEKLSGYESILLGGYADDKNQMVLIKVFGQAFDVASKVMKRWPLF